MKNVKRSVPKAYSYEGPHDPLPKIALLTIFVKSPMWRKEQLEKKLIYTNTTSLTEHDSAKCGGMTVCLTKTGLDIVGS
jgi:hypothetical protein